MTDTAQGRGRKFEQWLASRFKMKQKPQSGAGVLKLDVGERQLVISAKHTDAESIRITADMLAELKDATSGAGGIGADVTAIMAIQIGHPQLVGRVALIDLEDLIALLEQDVRLVPPTKDAQRRARASVPALLRDD